MGTWSADILGGDHPMDVLGYLGEMIGYDTGSKAVEQKAKALFDAAPTGKKLQPVWEDQPERIKDVWRGKAEEEDDGGLYPLEFTPQAAAGVRILLETNATAILDRKWDAEDYPVIAATYLSVGAEMPEAIRDAALKQCREEAEELRTTNADGWRNPEERIAVLENHAKLIEHHAPGKITPIAHKGLFATMGL